MAATAKCNKCKKIFKDGEVPKNSNAYNDIWKYDIVFSCNPYPARKIDLCYNCRIDFFKMMLKN